MKKLLIISLILAANFVIGATLGPTLKIRLLNGRFYDTNKWVEITFEIAEGHSYTNYALQYTTQFSTNNAVWINVAPDGNQNYFFEDGVLYHYYPIQTNSAQRYWRAIETNSSSVNLVIK